MENMIHHGKLTEQHPTPGENAGDLTQNPSKMEEIQEIDGTCGFRAIIQPGKSGFSVYERFGKLVFF
jgi:hypothetical protein